MTKGRFVSQHQERILIWIPCVCSISACTIID
ncbi:hypothetical protein LEMLEM_LOCUS25412 [Lemmus lemmus]